MIRPWYKSLVLWLGLPLLSAIVWLWVNSMFYQVRIENHANTTGVLNQWTKEFFTHGNSAISYSWADYDEDPAQTVKREFTRNRFTEKVPGTQWFPAYSHTKSRPAAGHVRNVLTLPYWIIALVYCVLWSGIYQLRSRWVRRRYADLQRAEWTARNHAALAASEEPPPPPADPRATRSKIFRREE